MPFGKGVEFIYLSFIDLQLKVIYSNGQLSTGIVERLYSAPSTYRLNNGEAGTSKVIMTN